MPAPAFTIDLLLPEPLTRAALASSTGPLAALPNSPGVLMLVDVADRALLLTSTANLRRLARRRLRTILDSTVRLESEADSQDRSASSCDCSDDKLEGEPDGVDPPDNDTEGTERSAVAVELGLEHDPWALAHRIRAIPAYSRFEQDWRWLTYAQRYLPLAATAAADRWVPWFLHVNPAARFPRFTKTRELRFARDSDASDAPDVYLGPLPDKHAAGQLIDALEATFDLCRYHHILAQTPHATACAYKELGRCPAPCDGSVSLDHYVAQIEHAIRFVRASPVAWIAEHEQLMQQASDALDYERAAQLHRRIEDARPISHARFRWLSDLAQFRFITCQPSPHGDFARTFIIAGDTVLPWADLAIDAPDCELHDLARNARAAAEQLDPAAVQDHAKAMQVMGLVCSHLFLPRKKQQGAFARMNAEFSSRSLAKLLRAIRH